MKSRDGKSQRRGDERREEKRREEKSRSKKKKSPKEEDPGARKGRKVTKHGVFPMICSSGGSKSRLAKAAGAEPAGRMRDEKLHAVVARSTFPSQNVQNTPTSDHFSKLNCAMEIAAKDLLRNSPVAWPHFQPFSDGTVFQPNHRSKIGSFNVLGVTSPGQFSMSKLFSFDPPVPPIS